MANVSMSMVAQLFYLENLCFECRKSNELIQMQYMVLNNQDIS